MKIALFYWIAVTISCRATESVDSAMQNRLQAYDYALDDVLRLNHVQAKGTHNSYHQEPEVVVHDSHRYSQPPLNEQLTQHGVRQFEIDLHYRDGSGFEVFHLPVVDEESSCIMFTDCLSQLWIWSNQHPGHLPIVVWLEPKDDLAQLLPDLIDFADKYDELEEVILSIWPVDRIFKPDDLRGDYPSLPAAISAEGGWPHLGKLRNKIIFSLLDSGIHRETYLADQDALQGKLLFATANDENDPWAAILKINDATNATVPDRLNSGFIITSNVDAADRSDQENAESLAASLAAGVQFLSSDYPAQVADRDYWFDLPDGAPVRCNPVTAPSECASNEVETLP